jgi:hypothetical protein
MRLSRPGIGWSLLLHALALCGVMQAVRHTPQYAPPPPKSAIVWLAQPESAPAPQPTEERPVATAEPAVGSADASRAEASMGPSERALPPSRIQPSTPAIARAPTPAPSPTETQPAAIARRVAPAPDLLEARRRAAVDVIEGTARADAHRSFEYPGTIAQQRAFDESERDRRRERGLQPPLTVFDSPAKGRAELPEETPRGIGVVWLTDDMYVFREPLDRFVLPGLFVEPMTFTRRFARTDLFATAKPYYLMSDEERKAVDAEKRRRELLRRPTTGAVMPLEKD